MLEEGRWGVGTEIDRKLDIVMEIKWFFFHTPDYMLEIVVKKNILTSNKIVKPLPRREPDFLIQLKKKKNLFKNKRLDPFQSTYFFLIVST